MLPVIWNPEAKADLQTIVEYIAERSPQAALAMHDAFVHAADKLTQHPHLYRPGRIENTRELVVHENYIVVYRVGRTAIEILSVLHSRQQYP